MLLVYLASQSLVGRSSTAFEQNLIAGEDLDVITQSICCSASQGRPTLTAMSIRKSAVETKRKKLNAVTPFLIGPYMAIVSTLSIILINWLNILDIENNMNVTVSGGIESFTELELQIPWIFQFFQSSSDIFTDISNQNLKKRSLHGLIPSICLVSIGMCLRAYARCRRKKGEQEKLRQLGVYWLLTARQHSKLYSAK